MNRFVDHTFAALAALVLAFSAIGAIVSVPPAQTDTLAALALPVIA